MWMNPDWIKPERIFPYKPWLMVFTSDDACIMVSPPTSRGAGARSYYKYVSESVNQTQIVDHCLCKQHIVCQPDPGMVSIFEVTLGNVVNFDVNVVNLLSEAWRRER